MFHVNYIFMQKRLHPTGADFAEFPLVAGRGETGPCQSFLLKLQKEGGLSQVDKYKLSAMEGVRFFSTRDDEM